MGIADGYAQVSGSLAAVNVHVQPGLANAMSGILNAARARVPVLVTVGQQVQDLLPGEPFLGGELVELCRPLAKGAWEVTRPGDLPRLLALAVRTAREQPSGPVVLSLPLDVQVAPSPPPHAPASPASPPPPDAASLARAAELLGAARAPARAGRGRRGPGRGLGGAGRAGGAPGGADPGRAAGRHGAPAHRSPPLAGTAAALRRRDRPSPRAPRRGARRGDAGVPALRDQPGQRPPAGDDARPPGGGPPRGGQGPRARRRPRGGPRERARRAARAPGSGPGGRAASAAFAPWRRWPPPERRRGRASRRRRSAIGWARPGSPAPSRPRWSATTWWSTRRSPPGAACGP